MKRQYTSDDLEDYLHGRMGETEREALEAQMAADPELAGEVRFLRNLQRATASLAEQDFARAVAKMDGKLEGEGFFSKVEVEAQVEEARSVAPADREDEDEVRDKVAGPVASAYREGKGVVGEEGIRRLQWHRALAIAASMLLLLAAGAAWWASRHYSDAALANRNFAYDIPNPVRSEASPGSPLAKGQQAFADGRLAESIEAFGAVAESSGQYVEARYYLAHALFRQKDYAGAAANFELVRDSGDRRYREEADWKLLLALLAAGEQQRAEALLEQLANSPGHAFQAKAEGLKNRLGSLWRLLAF